MVDLPILGGLLVAIVLVLVVVISRWCWANLPSEGDDDEIHFGPG